MATLRTLRLLLVTALALCLTLGMLGNASATGLLGVAGDDACGDSCPCEREAREGAASDAAAPADERAQGEDELEGAPHAAAVGQQAHSDGDHVGPANDCEDDCPDCGSVRHALAGLPGLPVVVRHPGRVLGRSVADAPPQSPLLDNPAGVFRPPRALTAHLAP